MRLQRLASMALAGILAISTIPYNVLAASGEITTDKGSSQVPAKVTAEAAQFSVTVPAILPIDVSADGTVTTADDVKIVNNSASTVKVTKVSVEAINDWQLAEFDSDFTRMRVNEKKFGLQLQTNNVQTDGTCGLDGFTAIPGNGGELPLAYDANLTTQTTAIDHLNIANVTFTIGWDDGTTSDGDDGDDGGGGEYDDYIDGPVAEGIIPEGGTYYVKVPSSSVKLGGYSGAEDTLEAGEPFPEVVNTNDVYVYDNYEYRYNYYYTSTSNINTTKWNIDTNQNGWGVRVIDTKQTEVKPILFSIAGQDVTNLNYALAYWKAITTVDPDFNLPNGCKDVSDAFLQCYITELPEDFRIPKGLTEIYYMFIQSKLSKLPDNFTLPETTTSIQGMFCSCTELTSIPESFILHKNLTNINSAFKSCNKLSGELRIDCNIGDLDNWMSFLEYAVTDGESKLTLVGESAMLPMYAWASGTNADNIDVTYPEHGTYFTNVTTSGNYIDSYSEAIQIRSDGDFPHEPQNGDVYIYGQYQYRYNKVYTPIRDNYNTIKSFEYKYNNMDGWCCHSLGILTPIIDPMETTINGKDVLNTSYAFRFSASSYNSNGKLSDSFNFPQKAKDISYTFDCLTNKKSIENLPDTLIIPETITNATRLFDGFTALNTLPDGFKIPSSCITASGMFNNCDKLKSIDNFIIENGVENVSSMFSSCDSLGKVSLTIPESVTNISSMFSSCPSLYGNITINCTNLDSRTSVFAGSCTSSANLVLNGTCIDLDYIASSCSTGKVIVEKA